MVAIEYDLVQNAKKDFIFRNHVMVIAKIQSLQPGE